MSLQPLDPASPELQAMLDRAYEIGALAMAHYFHGDYAGDDYKMDHGNRAMRREHLDWALANYPKLKAELTAADAEFFKDVPLTEEPS